MGLECIAELSISPKTVIVFPASESVPEVSERLLLTRILLFDPRIITGVVEAEPITK
jgi:hypothetical protein